MCRPLRKGIRCSADTKLQLENLIKYYIIIYGHWDEQKNPLDSDKYYFFYFSDMKTMLGDFRQGLPDYIEKIISKKLDEQDSISLHTNRTNIDEDSGFNSVNNNGDTDTLVQNNRDKGSHNTDADQGSAVGGIL